MATIEQIELRMVDLQAQGEAHRRHPELRQPGDADRHHHRCRRRDGHRLQLHDRHRRLLGDAAALATIWRRASSAATPTRSRRSGTSWNSPPTPRRSAPSRRSRSRRSTPRCGTCAPESRACRCGSSPAAPRSAARSTPPRAAGCTSRRRRWSTTRLPAKAKGFRGSKVKIGRPHGSEDLRPARRRCARRSATATRS